MTEQKNNIEETSTSLTHITLHKCENNLILIIAWNFQNFIFGSISIWLFNSFQTFTQIKSKLFLDRNEEVNQKQCTNSV